MFRSCTFLIAAFWLSIGASLQACQIPVFRYALERWWPDPYLLVVAHKGDLSPKLTALLDPYLDSPDLVNIEIEIINLEEADPDVLKRHYRLSGIAETPSLVLYYPDAPRDEPPVYSAPFTKKSLDRIIDSPARRQIASQILKGDSAVWIVLDQGTKEGGKEAQRLQSGLNNLAGYMELPEGVITPDEADKLMASARAGEPPPPGFDAENILNYGVPLRIGYSVIRINTRSEEESAFLQMLLASDPDLDPASGPVAIPIFGRGRMLQGLPVKTLIDEDILPDACYYICGACSCQVKGQNPGLDLLMKVDWEGALEGHTIVIEKELPPLSGAGDLVAAGTDRKSEDQPVEKSSPGSSESAQPSPTPEASDNLGKEATPESPASPSPAPNPASEPKIDEPSATTSSVIPWLALSVGVVAIGITLGSFLLLRRHQN